MMTWLWIRHALKMCGLIRHSISAFMLQGKDAIKKNILYFWMCYETCVRVKVSLFHANSLGKTIILMIEKN